jgi:hypothetical protein
MTFMIQLFNLTERTMVPIDLLDRRFEGPRAGMDAVEES